MKAKKSLIGQMRQVVTFKKNSGKSASGTGFLDGYVDLLTTRGYLVNKSGSKLNEYGEVIFFDDYNLTCRFQEALETNITTPGSVIVVINNKEYVIQSFNKIDQKRFYYTFLLAAKNS